MSEIEINKSTLSKINKNLKSLSEQNNYETILKFNKNINLLNKNIEVISSEIENLKKTYNKSQSENNYNKINIIEENKKNIIELILIKYENNKNFEKELEFLKKNSNTNLISNFEKISILMAEPYKGHNNLKSIFDDEVNIYLKEIIYKNKDSLFNKIILPYVDVSPTSENSINDDKIFKLKKIEQYLEKKQLEKVIQNIETISNYNKFFTLTLIEIRKYLRFKEELYNLI